MLASLETCVEEVNTSCLIAHVNVGEHCCVQLLVKLAPHRPFSNTDSKPQLIYTCMPHFIVDDAQDNVDLRTSHCPRPESPEACEACIGTRSLFPKPSRSPNCAPKAENTNGSVLSSSAGTASSQRCLSVFSRSLASPLKQYLAKALKAKSCQQQDRRCLLLLLPGHYLWTKPLNMYSSA